MPPAVSEWSNLILRWIHVLAGIFWIGQTYYFTKLEGRMALDEETARNSGRLPQVWLVHSGSFSLVEKQASPKAVPAKFYWFRWEALITWISGFLLLGLLYYSGGLLLDDSVSNIGMGTGVAIGLGTLIVGFAVYEGIYRSPLGRTPVLAGTICYLLVVALAYGLTHCDQRARGLHPHRRAFWHDHGRQRLDGHPARDAQDAGVHSRGKADRSKAGGKSERTHHPQHLHDRPADFPDDQQPLSDGHLRRELQLADFVRAGACGRRRPQSLSTRPEHLRAAAPPRT